MAANLATLVADKIRSGVLPLPPEPPQKYFAGKGTGQRCVVCEQAIAEEQLEFELHLGGRTLRFHERCLDMWRQAAAENMVPTPQALHGLSVLVVDDHRDTVDMFEQYLTLCGAQVTGASSAKAALAMLETHTVDATVVDLRMPREDGWSFLRQLRASRTASAHAAVFAISGDRYDQLDPASGFARYFFKPVDLDALVAALAVLPRRSD